MKKLQEIITEILAENQEESTEETQSKGAIVKDPIGLESLLTILVTLGLRAMLPTFKGWLALGITALDLKKQEIANKLKAYAKEKELDYKKAEKAANKIAGKLAKHGTKEIIDAIEEGGDDA